MLEMVLDELAILAVVLWGAFALAKLVVQFVIIVLEAREEERLERRRFATTTSHAEAPPVQRRLAS